MAQYLMIGSGRTARHFSQYFQSIGLSLDQWSRKDSSEKLKECLLKATHVLVLISDSAIEEFYRKNSQGGNQTWVHFSGALEIPGMISAHPLMTFSDDLYEPNFYLKIPFVLTIPKRLSEILPGLPNPSHVIKPEDKAYYHAMCVISGNFTTLLWQKMTEGMKKVGLPEQAYRPYMERTFQNLIYSNSLNVLTGPLARKDLKTVLTNDQALAKDSYQKLYRSFVEIYFPEAMAQIQVGEK